MRSTWQSAIVIFILFFPAQFAKAQFHSKWELGINLGMYTYQGDLTPTNSGSGKTPGYGFSLFANRIYSDVLSFRSSISYGKIRANDAVYAHPDWKQQRNFAFESPVLELSEMAVWSPFGRTGIAGLPVSPFLSGGIGLGFFHVSRNAESFNPEFFSGEPRVAEGLAADLATKPPVNLLVVPVGAGLRLPLTSHWSLQTEYIYRFTATDYLDGFSKSAGPDNKDQYSSLNVGMVYRFGSYGNIKCPLVFRKRFRN
jgi:opacity protein-like surface antigen